MRHILLIFLMMMLTMESYGAYFNWICEGNTPTGIVPMSDVEGKMSEVRGKMSEVRGKMSEVWYDLSGRRLNAKPHAKGIYINNGKKIVIK